MNRLLEASGYDVTTSLDLGYSRNADEEYIKYAKDHGMIFVTEDNNAAKIARFIDVDYIHLDITMKTRAVIDELKTR